MKTGGVKENSEKIKEKKKKNEIKKTKNIIFNKFL